MMSQNEVAYTSLPQEEGEVRPSYISTLPLSRDEAQDCRITAILFSVIMAIGLTLAITLPLTLKKNTAVEEQPDGWWTPQEQDFDLDSDLLKAGMGGLDDGGIRGKNEEDKDDLPFEVPYLDEEKDWYLGRPNNTVPDANVAGGHLKNQTSSAEENISASLVYNASSLQGTKEEEKNEVGVLAGILQYLSSADKNATEHPSDVISSNVTKNSNQTESVLANATVVEVGVINNTVDGLVPSKEEQSAVVVSDEDLNKTVVVNNNDTQELSLSNLESNDDIEELLNEMFSKSNAVAKPGTQDQASWTDLDHAHDMTVALVALIATLFLLGTVIGVTCVVHRRMQKNARRATIQGVITDLQSRDKIVLLHSDDSSEEE